MQQRIGTRGMGRILLWTFLFAVMSAPAGARELRWTGCGITQNAFMQEIAAAYRKKTGITIKISGGGATLGIRAAAAGTSDMGGTCRNWLGGPDNKHPLEADAELVQVAWDALVVVINQDNPINDIRQEDLLKIYDGKIVSWKELGGKDQRIALVTRSEDYSGVGYMFRLLVFNDPHYVFKARSFKVKSTGPLEKKIAATATALGIDGISSARRTKLKILSLNGVAPTKKNIASGLYPLFRPLYIAVNAKADKETREVIDFILSKEGQEIISAQGTVNLEEGKALEPLWRKRTEKIAY